MVNNGGGTDHKHGRPVRGPPGSPRKKPPNRRAGLPKNVETYIEATAATVTLLEERVIKILVENSNAIPVTRHW